MSLSVWRGRLARELPVPSVAVFYPTAVSRSTRCVKQWTQMLDIAITTFLFSTTCPLVPLLPLSTARRQSYAAGNHIHGGRRRTRLFRGRRSRSRRTHFRTSLPLVLHASTGVPNAPGLGGLEWPTGAGQSRKSTLGGRMIFLRYLLLWGGAGMIASAIGILARDLYLVAKHKQQAATAEAGHPSPPAPLIHWRSAIALALLAWGPILLAFGIVVMPSGMGGVRISQTSGTLPGTLYPGAHFLTPLAESIDLFDTRDQLFTAGAVEDGKVAGGKRAPGGELLNVQAKEGLSLGLAITVRYRLDPKHLDYIQANLPQPIEKEIVPAVVASAWRELVPNYTVREVFATRREEIRKKAADTITQKLAADGIVVKEVMLRDIQLPPEYAKGLEDLLLKEQEDDQMGVQTDIQQKQVRIAELQAEATKAQQVKQAEGEAQVLVLQAKAESDAMQYTLPLKQKQIEQTKLEAEAHKETVVQNAEATAQATVKNAEAMAQAKVIDSKAEMERRKLLAEAEADRIRVTAVADAERMKNEGAILKQNPLLINKIIAEKLSDKLQIMMVPSDGKFFFANDVLKSMNMANRGSEADQAGEK